ncbi:MAG: FAD-dependent oxidoreductase, partial [Balneolaceae bacterium]|nr:FAD-dependent oxidoreductase [Balneolaceae bacterium]
DYVLSAPLFVDASGDGNLGYYAGADYKWGRESRDDFNEPLAPDEPDEKVMGNTHFFTARDTGKPIPFKRPDWAAEFETEEDLYKRGHHHRGPEDTAMNGGYWWIEIGAPYHPINDMNEARHEGLRQLLGVWDHIKNKGDHGAENYGLEFAGSWPYKRESRRIRGDYILTQYDVQDPKQLDDAVAYGVWHMDLHVQGGILARNKEPVMWGDFQSLGTLVYGIPLRSLYSRSVNNLMMAGRPISCSYLAFASTRVLSTGSICGEAVGVAAALAKKYNTSPRQIAKEHAKECQQMILRQDGHIPGVVNQDPDDLARKATASGSSSSPMVFPDADDERELKIPHAQLFPVSEDRVDTIELLMRSERSNPTEIRLGLRHAPSVWDFRSEDDLAVAHATVPGNFDGWVRFELNAPVESDNLYYVYTDKQEGVYWQLFRDSHDEPSQTPVGTTAAIQPVKPPRSEQSQAYRETYSPTTLEDLPGTGENGRWEPLTGGQSLSMKVTPKSKPYGPQNVITGTNRPDQWSNIWISDPTEPLPAWLKLEWPSPQRFNTVQLTFDTNQNYRVTKPLYRYPESVRKYVLEYRQNNGWRELLRENDNYVRRRVHHFDAVQTSALRVRVLATNGIEDARIYEMRVYNEA